MLFFISFIVTKLSPETLLELQKEDLRMASHLQSHGYKVSNPKFPLLKPPSNSSKMENRLLSVEDRRMAGHLVTEGWTVYK